VEREAGISRGFTKKTDEICIGEADREFWKKMKRAGALFDKIIEPENLRLAFWKASKGKRHRDDQRAFAENLDCELGRMRKELIDGSFSVGNYVRFKVYDPKEREISAASFSERVFHHALMNVCEPFFEKWLVFDTYACRKGKGQFRAIRRAQSFSKHYDFVLKADIKKFFDSVSHNVLKKILRHKFKDIQLLYWFDKIIDTYHTTIGYGLPIGNLTSQFFANIYLDPLDRYIKETLGMKGYVRYMDDFLVWHNSLQGLKEVKEAIRLFVEHELDLRLKDNTCLVRVSSGVSFLGMKIYSYTVRLNKQSVKRFVSKFKHYEYLLANNFIDEREFQERVTALTAFVAQADSLRWRQLFFNNI